MTFAIQWDSMDAAFAELPRFRGTTYWCPKPSRRCSAECFQQGPTRGAIGQLTPELAQDSGHGQRASILEGSISHYQWTLGSGE